MGRNLLAFVPLILVVMMIVVPTILIPAVLILRRTGHSPCWCLLLFVPLLNLVGVWVFALARWPAVDKPQS
jgi:hypothetical protein